MIRPQFYVIRAQLSKDRSWGHPLILHATTYARTGVEYRHEWQSGDRTVPPELDRGDGWHWEQLAEADGETPPLWLVPTWVHRAECGRILYEANHWRTTEEGTHLSTLIADALRGAGVARTCQRCQKATT